MGNKIRVVVLVRINRIISESSCKLDTRHDSRAMRRTTGLIRHTPPSKHFDRQQDKPQETEQHGDRYRAM